MLRGPRSSSFWVPQNLSHHMDRQARTSDTVLVKSREMTCRTQTLRWWLEGEWVKTTENKIHQPRSFCSTSTYSIVSLLLLSSLSSWNCHLRKMETNGILKIFFHKPVLHRSLTQYFELFRFWLEICRDICNKKTTPLVSGLKS
jgi:hypothetical protein